MKGEQQQLERNRKWKVILAHKRDNDRARACSHHHSPLQLVCAGKLFHFSSAPLSFPVFTSPTQCGRVQTDSGHGSIIY